jgi:hypothetical protein
MAGARKCLEFGRDSARTECGVSYALDALSRRRVDVGAVRTGIETARVFAARAGELLPGARKLAKEVARAAAAADDEIRGLSEIPEGKAKKLRKRLEDLKEKARRLFAKGEGTCGR